MKTTLHSLFVIITAAISCNKVTTEPINGPEYTTTVTGTLLERGTNKPLAGEFLEIYCTHGSCRNALGGYDIFTDSAGAFEIVFTGESHGSMRIVFAGTSTHGYGASESGFNPFEEKHHNIISAPYGWIKYVVRNVNYWDGYDQLIIRTGGTFTTFNGLANDSIYSKEHGNGIYTINYGVFRNQNSTPYSDTIYLPGFDTVTYKIDY
jgi:hypothetical protein